MSGLREYLADGNDGPGGTSGRNMPKPCKRCGAPRPKGLGRGRYYCDPCQALRDAEKACHRCGGPKPPGRGKRLCDSCLPAHSTRPCHGCGERKPKANGASIYCADCRDLQIAAKAARRRARRRLRAKACRGLCGRLGPFYRVDDGKNTPYCPACRAERFQAPKCKRCQDRPVRGKSKHLCEECFREAHQRELERRRALEAAYRERDKARGRRRRRPNPVRRNEARRMSRRLAAEREGRTIKPAATAVRITGNDRVRELPAAPLAAFIETLIERETVGVHALGPDLVFTGETGNRITHRTPDITSGLPSAKETVCDRLGISVKSHYEWSHGKRKSVQFDVADRVLTAARVCWWDVWKACDAPDCSCAQCVGAEAARAAFEGAAPERRAA